MNFIAYFLVTLAVAATGEVVRVKPCEDNVPVECSVSEVRVEPCPEAEKNGPCGFKRGTTAKMQFDFVGKAGSNDLKNQLYWKTPIADLPLTGVDTVGCHFVGCPITGEQQTLNFTLPISKKYPARAYEVKWKLHTPDDSMRCCFLFNIKISK